MPAFSVLHATRRRKNSRARMTRYAHHSTSCFVFRNARTRVRHRLEDGVMKRLLLATATTVALIAANAAQAAGLGLPAKGPMAAPLPAWNWSGFCAGLNAGYARSTTVWNDLDGTINGVSGVLVDESTNGFIGGSVKQTTRLLDLVGPGATHWQIHDSMPWLGTVRGRVGLALDNVLIYATAGFAYGKAEHTVVGTFSTNVHDFGATKIGAVGGVGAEFGLDPRWSVKAEGLYAALGKNSAIYQGDANTGGFSGRFDVNDTMWIVRGGVNYKFGS